MEDLLKRLIATPSFSGEEGQATDILEEWLKRHSLDVKRKGNNLFLRSHIHDGKSILLNAHIDTVRPTSTWTRDPFMPTTEGDRLYGLGSNDDGASLVAMIATFIELQDRYNITLSLTAEEETSGKGGLEFILPELGQFDFCIIGEPTQMRAAISERGLLVIDAEAEGKSGHAARNSGINAIYIALDDICQLRQHEFSRISPTMGKVQLNVTQITAGTAHNIIPDRCSFVIDIRPTEQYTNEEIFNELQTICKSRLKARNLRNHSSATPQHSPLMHAIQAVGIETFSSPTTSNWMRIPFPAIKIGPGDSTRSHMADEYICLSEIEQGINGYIDIISEINNS